MHSSSIEFNPVPSISINSEAFRGLAHLHVMDQMGVMHDVDTKPFRGWHVSRPKRRVARRQLMHRPLAVQPAPHRLLPKVIIDGRTWIPYQPAHLSPLVEARLQDHRGGSELAPWVALPAVHERGRLEARQMVHIPQHDRIVIEHYESVKLSESECAQLRKGASCPLGGPQGHNDGRRRARQEAHVEETREQRLDGRISFARRETCTGSVVFTSRNESSTRMISRTALP